MLTHVTCYLEAYSNVAKHCEDHLFLFSPLKEEDYVRVCAIKTEPEYRCTYLFYKFWNQYHFWTGYGSYIYKENDFYHEELYLKKQLITFFKELGYARGVVPQDEALRKHFK